MDKPADISRNKLKRVRKLNKKKYRYEFGSFIVEGPRAIKQVLANNDIYLSRLYFDGEGELWKDETWNSVIQQYESYTVDPATFVEIADTDNPQGILAECVLPAEAGVTELQKKSGILVAFDRIRDPGNLGSMIRASAWFGVKGMIVGKGTVDPFHPKVVRGTAGATGSIPYVMNSLESLLNILKQNQWDIYLMDMKDGAKQLDQLDPGNYSVLVVGNEAHGIDEELTSQATASVSIPERGDSKVESLNASVALSIALYHFSMQCAG